MNMNALQKRKGRTGSAWCIFCFLGSGQFFDVFQDIFGGKLACMRKSEEREVGSEYILGFRSVMTTPHRSRTALSLLRSKSRSVVPVTVPVGMMASLTESWMTRDCTASQIEPRCIHTCAPLCSRRGHCLRIRQHQFRERSCRRRQC